MVSLVVSPILLVEDSEDDVLLFRRAFQRVGLAYPLQRVSHGQEAIEYLQQCDSNPEKPAPALMLLDIKLPYRTGFEVLEWVRTEFSRSQLPVVMLTSSNEATDRNRAAKLGANDYFVKPASLEELTDIVRQLDRQWFQRVLRIEAA